MTDLNYVAHTVQTDFQYIQSYAGHTGTDQEQDQKVARSALRLIAAVGMAFAALSGISALVSGSLLSLIAAGVIFTVSHDGFVILNNCEKGLCSQGASLVKGVWNDFCDLWNGHKTLDDVPRHPFSEGTILRPIWDAVLWS